MHESENEYLMLFNMLSVPLGFGNPVIELPELFFFSLYQYKRWLCIFTAQNDHFSL